MPRRLPFHAMDSIDPLQYFLYKRSSLIAVSLPSSF